MKELENREQDPVRWDLELAMREFVKAEDRIDQGKMKGAVLHLARGMAALCGAFIEAGDPRYQAPIEESVAAWGQDVDPEDDESTGARI